MDTDKRPADRPADPAHDLAAPDTDPKPADSVDDDDPHKVEKLTKAGRDIDPDEGTD